MKRHKGNGGGLGTYRTAVQAPVKETRKGGRLGGRVLNCNAALRKFSKAGEESLSQSHLSKESHVSHKQVFLRVLAVPGRVLCVNVVMGTRAQQLAPTAIYALSRQISERCMFMAATETPQTLGCPGICCEAAAFMRQGVKN